jgi:hypothetical protein
LQTANRNGSVHLDLDPRGFGLPQRSSSQWNERIDYDLQGPIRGESQVLSLTMLANDGSADKTTILGREMTATRGVFGSN